MVDSPHHPEEEVIFALGEAGVIDPEEAEKKTKKTTKKATKATTKKAKEPEVEATVETPEESTETPEVDATLETPEVETAPELETVEAPPVDAEADDLEPVEE